MNTFLQSFEPINNKNSRIFRLNLALSNVNLDISQHHFNPPMTLSDSQTQDQLVQTFNLERHPEGGFYRRVFRSTEQVSVASDPNRFADIPTSGRLRPAMTSIYYLIEAAYPSTWHRIRSEEIWHFYHGHPFLTHQFNEAGELETTKVGNPILHQDAVPQHTVNWGTWFAAEPLGAFSFCGCSVAPGFEFADFELGEAETLIATYPQHKALVSRLARNQVFESDAAKRDGFKK